MTQSYPDGAQDPQGSTPQNPEQSAPAPYTSAAPAPSAASANNPYEAPQQNGQYDPWAAPQGAPQAAPAPGQGYGTATQTAQQYDAGYGQQHGSHVAPQAIPSQAKQPGTVATGSVAGQVAEYIEIPGKGAVQLASMSNRLIARLIDSAILFIAAIILFVLFIAISAGLAGTDDDGSSLGVFLLFSIFFAPLFFLAFYLYEAIMIGLWGATVGKMLMKIKVVKPRNGNVPGLGAGFVRFLIPGLCGLIPFIGGLGSLVCLISPTFDSTGRRQGWHDKVANTVVVSAQ